MRSANRSKRSAVLELRSWKMAIEKHHGRAQRARGRPRWTLCAKPRQRKHVDGRISRDERIITLHADATLEQRTVTMTIIADAPQHPMPTKIAINRQLSYAIMNVFDWGETSSLRSVSLLDSSRLSLDVIYVLLLDRILKVALSSI